MTGAFVSVSAKSVENIFWQKASVMNMVALLSVGGVIAWAVMGVFDMQDQITSGMG